MTSITSLSGAALLFLQQANISATSNQLPNNEADVLKIANGVSSEPSQGTKSATAVIGKFAVDSVPPTTHSVVMGGLGAANSWEELKELVKNNATFSDSDKKEWFAKIAEAQTVFDGFESLSFSVESIKALAATRPTAQSETPADREKMIQTLSEMNNLLLAQGRDTVKSKTYGFY